MTTKEEIIDMDRKEHMIAQKTSNEQHGGYGCPIAFGDCHECEYWEDNQYCVYHDKHEPPEPADNMRMRR
jgi:hypothetical protein